MEEDEARRERRVDARAIGSTTLGPARSSGPLALPLDPSLEATDRVTLADLPSTSTSHTTESPGSSPRTVATGDGTVVFNDSVVGAARKTFDSNALGTATRSNRSILHGHISGLSEGRRIDLILKYASIRRPTHRPMSGMRGPWDTDVEERAIRLVSSRKNAIRPKGRLAFEVKSNDGTRRYLAVCDEDGWTCTCEFWSDRRSPCKHIVATVQWLDPNPPPILEEVNDEPRRKTYSQANPSGYDQGQQLEHQLFDAYLWDLLGGIREPRQILRRRGRPAIPLRTEILVAVRKVHLAESSRRARGLLVALNCEGKGILPRIPNYTAPSRFFNRPESTEILLHLIEMSGLVLKEVEDRGTAAVDSTGFSTSSMGSYFTEKYDPERRHQWLKAHALIGVKTHIVLTVSITDEHGADSLQFVPLLTRASALGHRPKWVVADKAYLGRENLESAGALGMDPYIPFKVNSRGLSKGSPMWNRKFHEFASRRDEFDEIYHRRSNVEATFSAIKRKLGEPLLSHNQGA